MRLVSFSSRVLKEIVRDPLNLASGLGFPIVLLFLLSMIQANIPVSLFEIERLAPGISVFSLSFLTLFSAQIISKDRESSFLERLYTTPLKAYEYILGYLLPILPLALLQTGVCYLFAFLLGMKPSWWILLAILGNVPIALVNIGVGLLCGSLLSVKQVGGICGALYTNLSAWLSGIWFDLSLVGTGFQTFAYLLPFAHSVDFAIGLANGNLSNLWIPLLWILGYGIALIGTAIFSFFHKMRKN